MAGVSPADAAERFLREIAARIAPRLVEEVHLFPPIRQGSLESGVAVIAAREDDPAPVPPTAPMPADAAAAAEPSADDGSAADAAATALAVTSPSADDNSLPVETEETGAESLASPYADVANPVVQPYAAAAQPASRRFAVYTARYRLTIKGPDRGQWEADIIAEADAPLEAVDAVVRGVQRRAGEVADAERLSGDAFRAKIGLGDESAPAVLVEADVSAA